MPGFFYYGWLVPRNARIANGKVGMDAEDSVVPLVLYCTRAIYVLWMSGGQARLCRVILKIKIGRN